MSFFGIKEISAYSGGLLDGVSGQYSQDSSSSTVSVATDGDFNTSQFMRWTSTLTWNLETTASINSIRVNGVIEAGSTGVNFYSESGQQLKSIGLNSTRVNPIDQTYNFDSVDNVKTVEIIQYSSFYNGFITEFDVFGQYQFPIPFDLQAVPDVKKISLTWQDSPANGFTGYDVYRDGVKINTNPIMVKSYVDSGLHPDVQHIYRVAAKYGLLQSQISLPVSAAAYDVLLPKPVLSALPFEDRIELSWGFILGATDYTLYANGLKVYSGLSLGYIHSDLSINQTFSYLLIIKDKYGRETSSDVLIVKTREPPPIEPLTIEVLKKTHQIIQIRWAAGLAPYTLIVNDSVVSDQYLTNTYLLEGLKHETTFSFRVGYVDKYGRYVESATTDVTTDSLPVPLYPVLQANNITHNSLRLSWNQTGSKYRVLMNGDQIAETASTFNGVYKLDESTEYTFQVISIDIFGRENPSNELIVKTLAAPPPKPTPPPKDPAPPVSDSKNPDLNKANDELVQGAKETKESSMSLIVIIVGIVILIFGTMWLIKIFKTKMSKASTGKAVRTSSSVSSSSYKPVSVPSSAGGSYRPMNLSQNAVKQNQSGQRTQGKRKLYVEKNYRSRSKRS